LTEKRKKAIIVWGGRSFLRRLSNLYEKNPEYGVLIYTVLGIKIE